MKNPHRALICVLLFMTKMTVAADYTLVINHGRVIDPESGLDAVRHIGISGKKIVLVSEKPLTAGRVIDASGLVVAPGFIDLHTHSPTPLGEYYQAFDGVTTALELEAGFFPVLEYGTEISEAPLINYGAAAGYLGMRIFEKNGLKLSSGTPEPKPVGLKGWLTAAKFFFSDFDTALSASFKEQASMEELAALRDLLLTDLDNGAIGVGLALDYVSAAIQEAEMRMIFEVAAQRDATIFVHVRRGIDGDPAGIREVIGYAREYEASVHICHITHNAISNLELFLREVREARAAGVDVTTELLPYNAGSALISSAVFGRDWQTIFNISYEDVEWAATGERFNKEMWDDYYVNRPKGQVIHHYLKEEWTQRAVQEPGVIIVSDLLPMASRDKKVAPHNGAFSKVLGRYVREQGLLDLATAIAKMTLLPARRLESYAPAFLSKGRIQENMDADITVFDPDTIRDNATYQSPYQTATGIAHVIVNGQLIIEDGQQVEGVRPGERILAR
ncbi:amidohydrolase family protein [Congregibacter variabilis]|uniref:Amidohydrolase family protein n=1 Tax=Congregibacter variabilis TaxID=3081200 RepID=A0ABZ0I150_9GAMM|nr:amidohydrolase family protein [Congregibacter sp. IMCC43200]